MATVTPPVIVTADGRFEYALTGDDILVMARSIRKESMADRQAIAWCYAQRYVMLRQAGNWSGSLADMIEAFSQPINPKWFPDGQYCRPGGQYAGTDSCAHASSRPANATVPWSRIEPELQEFLAEWSRGHVGNNVPGVIDFRARDGETDRIRSGQSNRDLTYFPADTRNAFFTNSKSQRWPDGYVLLKPGMGMIWLYAGTVLAAVGVLLGTLGLTKRR